MRLSDRIRLRYGLKWMKDYRWVIAEWCAMFLALLYCAFWVAEAYRWAANVYIGYTHAEMYRNQAATNEQMLITCLNGGVIGRDDKGEVTACGTPLHFTLLKVRGS